MKRKSSDRRWRHVGAAAMVVAFCLLAGLPTGVAAQPLMPPHMGPALPDWLIGGVIGFFIGAGLAALLAKIGEKVERASGYRPWGRRVFGLCAVLGVALWAGMVYLFAVWL